MLHPKRKILSNTSVGTQNLTSNYMQFSLVGFFATITDFIKNK